MIQAYVSVSGRDGDVKNYSPPLTFPATSQEVKNVLDEIGIAVEHLTEYTFFHYETPLVKELAGYLSPFATIDELNFLASELAEKSEDDLTRYATFMKSYVTPNADDTTQDLINLASKYNDSCFYLREAKDLYELGERVYQDPLRAEIDYILEDFKQSDDKDKIRILKFLDVVEELIDYENYGQWYKDSTDGEFLDGFYIELVDDIDEEYDGTAATIPEKYKLYDTILQNTLEGRKQIYHLNTSECFEFEGEELENEEYER